MIHEKALIQIILQNYSKKIVLLLYLSDITGCNTCYITEIILSRHYNTRVREHLEMDRASHIYKHLNSSETCRLVCDEHRFEIIDQASYRYDFQIKKALHILWEKPSLNVQVKHFNTKLAL